MTVIYGDLERTLWNVTEAAEAAGVSRDVIYQWKARGKLVPVNRKGWPRFRATDVLTVERETRQAAGRTHAA